MDDLISRKQALEIRVSHGFNADGRLYISLGEVTKYLQELPSAQPEIIYCKDCKHAHLGSWYCGMWNNSPGFPIVKEDGFCWMAERKEE